MIRDTLTGTKEATFSLDLPSAEGPPSPTGTGFFVSPDGWFVTAAHVVATDGVARSDIGQAWLLKEPDADVKRPPVGVQWPEIDFIDETRDLALLRLDFARNKRKDWLSTRDGFPYLRVSARELDEGEPVYAFGYPLSEPVKMSQGDGIAVGVVTRRPRVTSAVVAARRFEFGPIIRSDDVQEYVLDKALNYGNSGGPIVATATGHVHAFCSRFQPVAIPQQDGAQVLVPSLYGVVMRLSDPRILDALRKRGVEVMDD